MIAVRDALALVLERTPLSRIERVKLYAAHGRVLAEDIVSDVDSPPHDKAIVDGFALRAEDLARGVTDFAVVEEIMAGMTPTQTIGAAQAARIMTGAPIPSGADCVTMVERTAQTAPRMVRIDDPTPKVGQNIVRRAAAMAAGQTIVKEGVYLRPIEIGLLAEVGRAAVDVAKRPVVAVLATGNELVEPSQCPGAGQIRNSNGPMLAAAVERSGGQSWDLGIARDDAAELRESLRDGLDADVLLVSGGVSMGDLDLTPAILRELGVEEVFHKVRLKPGKPLWFGVGRGASPTLVFGLPGNPVSSLVCFELFVRPAMRRMLCMPEYERTRRTARLAKPFTQRGERDTYAPADARWTASGYEVEPLPSQGSGDLCALAAANALAIFPAGDRQYAAGDAIELMSLE